MDFSTSRKQRIYATLSILGAVGAAVAFTALTSEHRTTRRLAARAEAAGMRCHFEVEPWPDVVPRGIARRLPRRMTGRLDEVGARTTPLTGDAAELLLRLPPAEEYDLTDAGLPPEVLAQLLRTRGGRAERLGLRGNRFTQDVADALSETAVSYLEYDVPVNRSDLIGLLGTHPGFVSGTAAQLIVDSFLGTAEPKKRGPSSAVQFADGRLRAVTYEDLYPENGPGVDRGVGVRTASASYGGFGLFIAANEQSRPELRLHFHPAAAAKDHAAPRRVTLSDDSRQLLRALRLQTFETSGVTMRVDDLPREVAVLSTDFVPDGFVDYVAGLKTLEDLSVLRFQGGDRSLRGLRSATAKRVLVQGDGGTPLTGEFLNDFGPFPAATDFTVIGHASSDVPHDAADLRSPRTPVDLDFTDLNARRVVLDRLDLTGSSLATLPPLDDLTVGGMPLVSAADLAAAIRRTRPRKLTIRPGMTWDRSVLEAVVEVAPSRCLLSPSYTVPPEAFAEVADDLHEVTVVWWTRSVERDVAERGGIRPYLEAVPGSRPQRQEDLERIDTLLGSP